MGLKCCKTIKSKKRLGATIDFLKVISEKNRLKILCLLGSREMCVCEIWEYLNLPQNLVSHHLKVLKDFNLVDFSRKSTKIIYSVNKKEVKKYSDLLSHYLKL